MNERVSAKTTGVWAAGFHGAAAAGVGSGGTGGRGEGGDTAASQTNPKENGVAFGEAVFIFLQTS